MTLPVGSNGWIHFMTSFPRFISNVMSAGVPQKPNTQTHTQTIQAGKRENATKQIHSKCKLEKGENATNQIQNKYTENPSMEKGGNATNKIHRKSRHEKKRKCKAQHLWWTWCASSFLFAPLPPKLALTTDSRGFLDKLLNFPLSGLYHQLTALWLRIFPPRRPILDFTE